MMFAMHTLTADSLLLSSIRQHTSLRSTNRGRLGQSGGGGVSRGVSRGTGESGGGARYRTAKCLKTQVVSLWH